VNGDLIEESYGLAFLGGGADSEQARPIEVSAGSVTGAADITMSGVKKIARHIRGVLINGSTSEPARNASVQAIPVIPNASMIVPAATTDANGVFDIPAVFTADPTRTAIVLNFLRLNGGGGGTVVPTPPPTPTPPTPTVPTAPGTLEVMVTCKGLSAVGAPVRLTADGRTVTATTNPQGMASFALTGTGSAVVSAGPTGGCGIVALPIVRDGQGQSVTLALAPYGESQCLSPFLPAPVIRYDESGALIVLGCQGTVIR